MAYRYEKETGDLIIDGFENGIADAPEKGFGDMRCMNIISTPGEAMVQFSLAVQTNQPTLTSVAFTGSAATDVITYTGASMVNGTAVVFTGGSLPAGITAGTVYWAQSSSGSTFKVAANPLTATSPVNITVDGSGTFSTINMGQCNHWTTAVSDFYTIDTNGRVWTNSASFGNGSWTYTGNTTLTNASGNGIIYYQANDGTGYIFAFRNSRIDYFKISTVTWTYGWQTLNTANGSNNSHFALVGQDNTVYYCDGSFVGSFFEKPGSTFDPATAATYTWAQKALSLPTIETSTWLAELGVNLLVSGVRNYIYPWDRISTSFSYPILVQEANIQRLLTVGQVTFVFAGARGRIYYTNGGQATLFRKIPDHISNTPDPLFTWRSVGTYRNQLMFGVSVQTSQGATSTDYGGVWAIDLDTQALRIVARMSYGTYAGYPSAILTGSESSSGQGYNVAWYDGVSSYGIDGSSTTPYTNYEPTADSDIIPVGTFLDPQTFNQIEYKLASPLTTGEGVKISYRTNLAASYTQVFESTTAGVVSDLSSVNFEKVQWVQFRVQTKSSASVTPSFVRLKELRIRASD